MCRSPEAGGGECEVETISELNETWAAGSSEQQQQVFSNIAAFWVELSQEGEGACSLIKVLRQYVKWAFKPKAALRIFESKTFHPSWSLWTSFPISHILCLNTGLAWCLNRFSVSSNAVQNVPQSPLLSVLRYEPRRAGQFLSLSRQPCHGGSGPVTMLHAALPLSYLYLTLCVSDLYLGMWWSFTINAAR